MTNELSSNAAVRGALAPEDCDRILLAALQAGDIETSVALYEPDAACLPNQAR